MAFPPPTPTAPALLRAYAEALAQQPWLELWSATLAEVVPARGETETWFLRDTAAHLLPCHPGFAGPWRLLALSGGLPLTVFGEWNGQQFWPLSAWRGERFAAF
ncbi:MAG: hypothetical protein MZV65_46000 [Chromatiales bacterium]|nr:hypothetical protein [Chromatiales bacterium]